MAGGIERELNMPRSSIQQAIDEYSESSICNWRLYEEADKELAALTARVARVAQLEAELATARELLNAEVERELDMIEHYQIAGAPVIENEWLTKSIAFLATEPKP
jgi:hypothetical protein